MKQLFLGLPFLLLLNCTTSDEEPNAKVDAEAGYKDLRLDSPFASINGKVALTPVLDDPCTATKTFEISAGDYLHLNTFAFDKVELEFVHDTLYSIRLKRDWEPKQIDSLLAFYRAEYGKPSDEQTQKVFKTVNAVVEWRGVDYYLITRQRGRSGFEVEYISYKGMKRYVAEWHKCEERKPRKG